MKEQMRQEAEERKLLEQQKKQVEAEESKYEKELLRITERMQAASSEEIEKLRSLKKYRLSLMPFRIKRMRLLSCKTVRPALCTLFPISVPLAMMFSRSV